MAKLMDLHPEILMIIFKYSVQNLCDVVNLMKLNRYIKNIITKNLDLWEKFKIPYFITNENIKDFSSNRYIKNINLQYCTKITDDCLEYLPNVTKINLAYSKINGDGFKYLNNIKIIDISFCQNITKQNLILLVNNNIKNANKLIIIDYYISFCTSKVNTIIHKETVQKDLHEYLNNNISFCGKKKLKFI
jgi:hypothetical protein